MTDFLPFRSPQHTGRDISRDLVPLDVLESALCMPSISDRSASPTDSDQPSPHSQRCLWLDCTKAFPDPETLYNHLCNDHIGRKSTNNLCLTCKWKDCGTTCAKRDHVTSHLRGASPLHFPSFNMADLFPLSPHSFEASYMRGMPQSASTPISILTIAKDLQEVFQASPGPQETRKDPHRRASRSTQTFKGDHRRRSRLYFQGTR
jgi:hypothetical protein